jgi:hypothetical protein
MADIPYITVTTFHGTLGEYYIGAYFIKKDNFGLTQMRTFTLLCLWQPAISSTFNYGTVP